MYNNKYIELFESMIMNRETNNLDIDYNKNNKDSFNTKFGKFKLTPFSTKLSKDGVFCYSVYNIKSEDKTNILKILKYHSYNDIDININQYKYFIKRTAIYINAKILKQIKCDILLNTKSSSFIINDLLDEIKLIRPDIKIITDKLQKVTDLSKIYFDKEQADEDNISVDTINSVSKSLQKQKDLGTLQMKKIPKQFAKYIKGYFEVEDTYRFDKLNNKNIVILDDVLSTGSSFTEMIRLLKQFNPSMFNCISIFKLG